MMNPEERENEQWLEEVKQKFYSLSPESQAAVYARVFSRYAQPPGSFPQFHSPEHIVEDIKSGKWDGFLLADLDEFVAAIKVEEEEQLSPQVSHKTKIPKGAEPFLGKAEYAGKAAGWEADASSMKDRTDYRTDFHGGGMILTPGEGQSIRRLHNHSFTKEIIPKLLERKEGKRLKILDVGGGRGKFAEEIRKKFGDRVDVYSTGLSKSAEKKQRWLEFENNLREVNNKYKYDDFGYGEGERWLEMDGGQRNSPLLVHKNDMKWSSILQLSKFEEFDLIADTYGEFFYTTNVFANEKKDPNEMTGVDLEAMKRYLEVVCSKLMPGGLCSIAPFRFLQDTEPERGEIKIAARTDLESQKSDRMSGRDISSLDLQETERLLKIIRDSLSEAFKLRDNLYSQYRATRLERFMGRFGGETAQRSADIKQRRKLVEETLDADSDELGKYEKLLEKHIVRLYDPEIQKILTELSQRYDVSFTVEKGSLRIEKPIRSSKT